MVRVHGEIRITRRPNQKYKKTYSLFKGILREDFKNLCGYCGKDAKCFKEDYQIDHFVPKVIDPDRVGDYYNLVYACRQCNRAKWDKWPTKDIDKPHDNICGFVDPASDEYDNHIERDANGKIIGITPVGKYIVKELNLDIRPIEKVWLVMQLYHYKKELGEFIRKNKDKLENNQYKLYYELDNILETYLDYFYNRR